MDEKVAKSKEEMEEARAKGIKALTDTQLTVPGLVGSKATDQF